MNRTEFIIATAIILFAAFMLGWFASWLIHRLSRVTRAEMGELESMAQQLHEAEEARDSAVDQLEEREAELVERLSRTAAELRAAGFAPDYAVIRRPDLSEPADVDPGPRVALVAARLGRTRLIDNLEFELPGSAG